MVLAFVEDGTLRVFATAEEAVREFEGIDVESGVVTFYDEGGRYLRPNFSVPNRVHRFLWIFSCVQSGVYTLVPDATTETDPLEVALLEVSSIEPNPWFSTLAQLKGALRERGVKVDTGPT